MSAVPLVYRVATHAVRVVAPLLEGGTSKLARGIAGRRHAHDVLARWGEAERDPRRPTVWFHAPSVGEGLQAGATVKALATRRPGLQVAFTHFSPSAAGWGARLGADVSAYLPWDVPGAVGAALDGVRPDLLAFTKTEVWPVLVQEATRRRIPVVMVAGTVPGDAGRLRWPARGVLRSTWRSLTLVCACSDDDAARLVELGARAQTVHVTGDPGVDAAAERAARADPASPTLAILGAERRPTVVAGSTWPADEDQLLPALEAVRRSVADLRVVVAPHEPSAEAVRALSDRIARMGLRASTLAQVETEGSAQDVDAVVVERVGVLADLYSVADVAYVGGGFGGSGLHSVLEPAAAGAPVLFGPRHARSTAAGALLSSGGARSAADRGELTDALTLWLGDRDARMRAAEHASIYIESHRGAAGRIAELLDPLLHPRSDP